MKIFLSFILFTIISQNTLLGKTVNAYRISSIFYDEDIKFSELFKYYFYGYVCDIKIEKNALGEISSANFDICDVENSSNTASRQRHYDAGEEYNIMAREKNIHGRKLCFKIKDTKILRMAETYNSVYFRSIEFKENCKFISKINYSKSQNKINGELLHKSFIGENVNVIGLVNDMYIGGDYIRITLKNKSSEYNCDMPMYRQEVEKNKDRLFKVIKKIRDKNNVELGCHGRVFDHSYINGKTKFIYLYVYDLDIIRL